MRSCSLFVSVLFLSGMVVRGGARVAPPLAKLRLTPLASMTAAHSGVTHWPHTGLLSYSLIKQAISIQAVHPSRPK
jgi:hypothetical protein